MILISAALNGFGASILWVAQGRYISRIANNSNKGTFNSTFWAFFMSSQVIGALFAAEVLKNTDDFNFYCIMTSICFFSSLFFLFLRPVKPEQQDNDYSSRNNNYNELDAGAEDEEDYEEPPKTTMEGIKDTFNLLISIRMLPLYPVIALSSINQSIFATTFINIMKDTMDDPDDPNSDSKALLCMLGLGSGEIIGAKIFGYITDNFTFN